MYTKNAQHTQIRCYPIHVGTHYHMQYPIKNKSYVDVHIDLDARVLPRKSGDFVVKKGEAWYNR